MVLKDMIINKKDIHKNVTACYINSKIERYVVWKEKGVMHMVMFFEERKGEGKNCRGRKEECY